MKRIIFLRTSSKPIPRVKRVAHVANELGYETLFVGAYRDGNLKRKDVWDGLEVERVGKFYPMLNGVGLMTYLKGVVSYNRGAFKLLKDKKPDVIHFSDVESFFAVFFYRIFSKVSTLYNIHDNFGQRYPLPKLVNQLLNIFEGLIVRFTTATMVPEQFRADALPKFCRSKIQVVRNTPVDPGASPHAGFEDDKIKLVFAGWLDEGRGIDTLLELAEMEPRVELHVAGEGSKELIERLESKRNCKYYGFLDHEQVLSLTRECDFVFAHYSPHRTINIYAAPNKLAESLAVSRPVIINSEALVSKPVQCKSCGIVTDYGDVRELHKNILALVANYDAYISACKKARELFEEEYSWESVKESTVAVFKKIEN
ncbi:glycosyltransferase [Pleionea mediterranea]|uniref:Glycosyltransferase involved in cell wall biosynthesis n=1 Tax=Pleionea mediterranea TaxID=523701 RepID=A0A316FQ12_9GAMM|nr:glycosyltransferase [Pleionea mediterranea]PWK50878.1 glycosyltransferase involved in cell wall biosynthesis [Pleionea mediterranea]